MQSSITLFFVFLLVALPVSAQFHAVAPYVEEHGKMMVEAEINGHKGRFLLDTAAPCAVTYSFMRRAGVPVVDSLRVVDSNGNIMSTDVVALDSLKLGDVNFTRMQAICLQKGNIVEEFKVDGVIGYNLMRMGCVKFDSRRRLFTLTSRHPALRSDSIQRIPLIRDRFMAYIPVGIGCNSVDTVMFDTGASGFYNMAGLIHSRLRESDSASFEQLGHGKGILSLGVAGVEMASEKYRLKIHEFKVGEASFSNVTTITTDGFSRVGSGLLRYGDVIIDYPENMFYFNPFSPGEKHDLYEKEWDAVITVIDDRLTIGMVWNPEDSPFKGGERITEIEGRRYDNVNLHDATNGSVYLPDTEARVKYIDPVSGEERETIIRRR